MDLNLKFTAKGIYKLEKMKGKGLNDIIANFTTDTLIGLIQVGTGNDNVEFALQKIDDYINQDGDNNGHPKDVYNLYCDICDVLFHDGFLANGSDVKAMRDIFNTKKTTPLG